MATQGIIKDYSIEDIGKDLQHYGLRVGENPAFGKVGKHAPGSYHYSGQAIDVTDWRPDVAPAFPGGKPIPWKQRTEQLSYRAKKSGLFTEALGPGDPSHQTHVHLALKDKAKATPELIQWIATGRYKTPQGKITDVMPALGQIPPAPQLPPAQQQQQPAGNTYIYIGGRPKKEDSTEDFLSAYIRDTLYQGTPEIKSTFDPIARLKSIFEQNPNYAV